MDGVAFSEELTAQLKSFFAEAGAEFQLIRKPGREGQQRSRHHVYIAYCEQGVVEETTLDSAEELLSLDLSGPGAYRRVTEPVLLVCTHGKRDQCCAIKGRPLAASLDAEFPHVWESSHTKGHRFAPSMILLPWGYSYGRLNPVAAAEMMRAATEGKLFTPGCRGRGLWDMPGQVAELAIADYLQAEMSNTYVPAGSVTVDVNCTQDSRAWRNVRVGERKFIVELAKEVVEGVVASCGHEPKRGKKWVSVKVEEQA